VAVEGEVEDQIDGRHAAEDQRQVCEDLYRMVDAPYAQNGACVRLEDWSEDLVVVHMEAHVVGMEAQRQEQEALETVDDYSKKMVEEVVQSLDLALSADA
jgi:hypothetical protein